MEWGGEPPCTTEHRSDMEGSAKSRRTVVAPPPLRLSSVSSLPPSNFQPRGERIPRQPRTATPLRKREGQNLIDLSARSDPDHGGGRYRARRARSVLLPSFLPSFLPACLRPLFPYFALQECNNPFTTAIHLTSHPAAEAAAAVVTQRAFRSGISPRSLSLFAPNSRLTVSVRVRPSVRPSRSPSLIVHHHQ